MFTIRFEEMEHSFANIIAIGLKPYSELSKLTNDVLVALCKEYDIAYSGKNKSQLIHSIKEYAESINDKLSKFDDTFCSSVPMEIQSYIAETGLHVIITKAIIKSIARVKVNMQNERNFEDDGTVSTKNDGYIACAKMYHEFYDRYKNPVFDDICQEVYIAMHILADNGNLTIENGKLVFGEYETEKGEKRSYYITLFKALRACLSVYRQTDSKLAKNGNYAIVTDGETGHEKLVAESSTCYLKALSSQTDLQAIADRQDIKNFMRHIFSSCPKQAKNMMIAFCGQVDGLSEVDASAKYGVSRRTYQRAKVALKAEWQLWSKADYDSHNSVSASYITTTCNGDSHIGMSYKFSYGDIITGYKPIIKKSNPIVKIVKNGEHWHAVHKNDAMDVEKSRDQHTHYVCDHIKTIGHMGIAIQRCNEKTKEYDAKHAGMVWNGTRYCKK